MKEYTEPRMHTVQHLLNQTMVRMFGCQRSFSAHIEKKKSKCDYHFTRNITEEEKAEIENRINAVIAADLPVTKEFLPKSEASDKYDVSRLPDSIEGLVGIVKIGDYDACPCGGQHVKSTGEIGCFTIVSSSFCDGVLRIRFKLKNR